ncbi:MAG: PIN domain-containing protein [Chloroflexi bacterium]|nr:PIN domain-containing protein [Chloroflexota bacterium]
MPRLDANIIIRYVVFDPIDQAKRATRLFERIERGEMVATIDEITVAEVVWTLSSFYRLPKKEVAESLLAILAHEGIHCPDHEPVRQALMLFHEKGISFADALLCARAIGDPDNVIYSFDHHFDRVAGVVRREPD